MNDILQEIVEKKKEKILLAKQKYSEDDLKAKIKNLAPAKPFIEAIRLSPGQKLDKTHPISLIAEIKQRSPSAGKIRDVFIPAEIAKIYAGAGAKAISVLTQEDHFGGNLFHINQVKSAVNLPVLRKDFIVEPYQVYESRYFGADAMLLIADLLPKEKLSDLISIADGIGLACLVEVHTVKELHMVLGLKAPLIGINNRDLHTLEVDFKTTEKIFPLIPKDKVVVVESGIKNSKDVTFFKLLGADAVLIGEAFMEAADIRAKIKEIMGQ